MARRTPFHAFLTKIASEGKSCPSGSTMVAGKCVSNEASTSRTLSTTIKISPTGGIVAPEKKLIMSEVSSGKHDISPTGGISASSISSTPTTFQKAVSTPTIAIQKPETVVLGGISISPASGVTTSIKRTVAVHEEQPVTRTPISIGSSRTIVASSNPSGSSISSDQISAIKEKISASINLGTSSGKEGAGGSISGVLPTTQKAISGPTITLAQPTRVADYSTPNAVNPNRVADYSTPNAVNPNTVISEDSIKAIREKITLTGGVSVSSQSKPRTAIYDNIDAKQNLGGSSGTTVVSGKAITTPTITPAFKPIPVTEAKPVTKVDESAGYR